MAVGNQTIVWPSRLDRLSKFSATLLDAFHLLITLHLTSFLPLLVGQRAVFDKVTSRG